MSLRIKMPLMAPADTVSEGTPAIDGPEANQSIENFLLDDSDDDDEALNLPPKNTPRKATTEGDNETPEEEAEGSATLEDELEEELADVPDDKLELMEAPRRAEILKEFPEIFKKFPYLEHAYYRDQKYTEIFPTPNDAQDAAEKAGALDNFEDALMRGETKKIFESVRTSDPQAFNRLVDNLLIHLGEVDEGAQIHIIGNVGKHIRDLMLAESNTSGNEALKHAAILLNQFITGSSNPIPQTKLAKEEARRDETLDNERVEFLRERFDTARTDIISRLDSKITNTLAKRVDPNESMTEFVREAAINQAKREVQSIIARDSRFQTLMKQAWQKAARSMYAKADIDYIRQKYENKAATLLPSVINKVRSKALKGLGRRSDETTEIREPQRRGPVASGKSAAPLNSGLKNARDTKAPPKGMSVKDFLMSD